MKPGFLVLVVCCMFAVVFAIAGFLMFPVFVFNSDGKNSQEIVWNDGVVKIVDHGGLGIHMNYVVFLRQGERAKQLCFPHLYTPSLSINADGSLRTTTEFNGPSPSVAAEGEEVAWNGGMVKIAERSTFTKPKYFVYFYRGGELKESLLDMGHYKPRLTVNEQGVLTVEADVLPEEVADAPNYPS